jgi:hypothetical protein
VVTTVLLKGLPREGDRPFIAALPQAVLANPDGPLAFIGHVDLAWTYSFSDLDSGVATNRPGKFVSIVTELLKGSRCGIGFSSLMQAFVAANTDLSTLYVRQAGAQTSASGKAVQPTAAAGEMPLEVRRSHLWMLRQDLCGYVLLGDPAVRLPIASARDKGTGSAAPAASSPATSSVSTTQAAKRPANEIARASTKEPSQEAAATAAQPAAAAQPDYSSLVGFTSSVPQPKPIDVDAIERAVAQIILGSASTEEIAANARLSSSELLGYVDRYRQAGRAAIKKG